MTNVVDYKELEQNPDILAQCGGKANGLFRLQQLGLSIPAFIVIPARSFTNEFGSIVIEIQKVISQIDQKSDESIRELSSKISNIVCNYSFSDTFCDEILKKVKTSLIQSEYFSVRSSAIGEDGSKDSFAGQLKSFLYVNEDRLLEKVKHCFASAFSPNVIKYKLLRGLDLNDFRMAVVIQQMVNSERSGVMFSMNSAGNLNETLIVAGYGQGEGIVADRAESDSYYVNRQDKSVMKQIIIKKSMLVFDRSNDGGLIEISVNEELADKAVLNNHEIQQLFEIGQKLEEKYELPQDIEFAFENDNLFLLQTRPVTTIVPAEIKILDNSNIVESYPGITLPLTFTFARTAYKYVFSGTSKAFKISTNDFQRIEEGLTNLITRLDGRIYYNLHNWYRMMRTVIVSSESLQAWENLIGIRNRDKKALKASFFKKLKSLYVLISLVFTYKRLCRNFYIFFNKEYTEIRNFVKTIESNRLTARQIYKFYNEKSEILFTGWSPTIINDFFTFKSYDLLKKKVLSYGFKEEENLANDLLCGVEGVESELPVLSLLDLKKEVEDSTLLTDIFAVQGVDTFELLKGKGQTEFLSRLKKHIDLYGDRTLEELKLETPNLRMEPFLLIDMIRNQLGTENSSEAFKDRQKRIRSEAEQKIRHKQSSLSLKTWLFNVILSRTREAVKNRENMRLARTRAYGTVKEIFMALGRRMAADGIIQKGSDVFYLTTDQLYAYAIKDDKQCLKQYVQEEKQKVEEYKNLVLPDRIMYQGTDVPVICQGINTLEHVDGSFFGLGVSKGKVRAEALVIEKADISRKINNEILVTRMTDPGWIFLMSQASGIISEKGSLLSHTAIVGRELGIPTIVGVPNITKLVKTGETLEMDGAKGEVRRV